MKIEGNKKITGNPPDKKVLKSSLPKSEELKQVEQSSLNAMANYGQAQVSMSFKGNIQPQNNFWELSDEEFERDKNELAQICLDNQFSETDTQAICTEATKNTIGFLKKICAGKKFPASQIYGPYGFNNILNNQIDKLDSDEDKRNMLSFIEEVFDNDNLNYMNCLDILKFSHAKTIPDFRYVINKVEQGKLSQGYTAQAARYINRFETKEEKDNAFNWVTSLFSDVNFPRSEIRYIFEFTNKTNLDLAKKICSDKDFQKENIWEILKTTSPENINLAEGLCDNADFPKDRVANVLTYANTLLKHQNNPDNKKYILDFIQELITSDNMSDEEINKNLPILKSIEIPLSFLNQPEDTLHFINIVKGLCFDKYLKRKDIPVILNNAQKVFPSDATDEFRKTLLSFMETLFANEEISPLKGCEILKETGPLLNCFYEKANQEAVLDFVNCIVADEDIPQNSLIGYDGILNFTSYLIKTSILENERRDILDCTKALCTDQNVPAADLEGYDGILFQLANILGKINNFDDQKNFLNFAKSLYDNKNFSEDNISGPREIIAATGYTIRDFYSESTKMDFLNLIQEICTNENFSQEDIANTIKNIDENNFEFAKELLQDENLPKNAIAGILHFANDENKEEIKELINLSKQGELPAISIPSLICTDPVSMHDVKKLQHIIGREKANKLSSSDFNIAVKFPYLYNTKNINEIPQAEKKNIVRNLVECNKGLFEISDSLKRDFPLIPTSQKEYCELLPSLVKSLGIETNELSEEEANEFSASVVSLSDNLASLSDSEYADLSISQEYSKDEFISDVFNTVKDLTPKERQKVYDYFGFELHHNKNTQFGFSITGYPVNLNNGKKLAQIEDNNTKAVVEKLRPYVIKFSQDNAIKCSNPDIEKDLNSIIKAFPELRTMINKSQHKTHDFDLFKHSLKVLQKVSQDENFAQLNDSDKKIMLLASLFHDITKKEGSRDKTHQKESAFDTFYITKKLGLTRDEEIKLYTLIGQHEWLEYANTAKDKEQRTKRLQNIAYDLHQDNLFDMALMFTHADLKAVKNDDRFEDTKASDFNGEVRTFGESADLFADKIRENIAELKKSQPLLPTTKFPKASTIDKAITQVNSDGSTNIKGVYKIDGNTVIKFNEVEDFEAIGFPKGSTNKSYLAEDGERETGNIKFFVHGLDFENQLNKFDAFSLPDSDALLSVSYAEAVETKNRFFRTQGVILETDTKYIHGGGETDSGSGYSKNIQDFKNNYVFGGYRESDRNFVSDLIKTATGMSDEEYIDFVEKNKNKQMGEIEPKEVQEKIIKAFATINSRSRGGNRAYNEMYISNPHVMGVFAYPANTDNKVGDINLFMLKQPNFLKNYAKDNDLPFVVFGD